MCTMYAFVCLFVCVYVCVHTYVCACTCTYIHMVSFIMMCIKWIPEMPWARGICWQEGGLLEAAQTEGKVWRRQTQSPGCQFP